MKQLKEERCYWNNRARENHYRGITDRTNQECIQCGGHDKDCKRYYGIVKRYPEHSQEFPYEEIRR